MGGIKIFSIPEWVLGIGGILCGYLFWITQDISWVVSCLLILFLWLSQRTTEKLTDLILLNQTTIATPFIIYHNWLKYILQKGMSENERLLMLIEFNRMKKDCDYMEKAIENQYEIRYSDRLSDMKTAIDTEKAKQILKHKRGTD